MTIVTAQLNGLRIAPRKVRLVAGLIKKKSVDHALAQLSAMAKRSVPQLTKLIASAVANAEHNDKLDRSTLIVKDVQVDEGVKLRRWKPKGFGRANPIEKKTSRITVTLESIAAPKPKGGARKGKKVVEKTEAAAETTN